MHFAFVHQDDRSSHSVQNHINLLRHLQHCEQEFLQRLGQATMAPQQMQTQESEFAPAKRVVLHALLRLDGTSKLFNHILQTLLAQVRIDFCATCSTDLA